MGKGFCHPSWWPEFISRETQGKRKDVMAKPALWPSHPTCGPYMPLTGNLNFKQIINFLEPPAPVIVKKRKSQRETNKPCEWFPDFKGVPSAPRHSSGNHLWSSCLSCRQLEFLYTDTAFLSSLRLAFWSWRSHYDSMILFWWH